MPRLPVVLTTASGVARAEHVLVHCRTETGNAAWAKLGTTTTPNATTINTPAVNDYVYMALTASAYAGKQITLQVSYLALER